MSGVSLLEPRQPFTAQAVPAALAVVAGAAALAAARSPLGGPAALAGCHSGGKRRRRESAKVATCGQYQGRWTCSHCGKVFAVVSHCRSRWCLPCARARSTKYAHSVNPAAFVFPSHLTLTLRAGPDVAGLVDLALRAFPKWARAVNVKRFVYAIEILRAKTCAGYFVHVHALIDCVYLNPQEARAVWQKLTGATHPPHVRRVGKDDAARRSAVYEVVKYATKAPDGLTPEEVDVLGRATHGRRLVSCSRGVRFPLPVHTKETSLPTEAGKSGGLPCPDCRSPLRFDGFERRQRPDDPDGLPLYDFAVLDAVGMALTAAPGRAGPPALAPATLTA